MGALFTVYKPLRHSEHVVTLSK